MPSGIYKRTPKMNFGKNPNRRNGFKKGNKFGAANKGREGMKEKNNPRANKDHKYRRNLKDWIRLCSSCHGEYDSKLIIKI